MSQPIPSGDEPSLGGSNPRPNDIQLGGKQGLLHLLEGLDSPDAEVRRRAAERLAEIGQLPAYDALIAQLAASSESKDKARILRALGSLRDPRAVPLLVEQLNRRRTQSEVRIAAAKALEKIHDPAVIPLLRDALVHDPGDHWYSTLGSIQAITDALTALGDHNLLEFLIEHASRGEFRAFFALGCLRDPRAVPFLLAVIQGTDERVNEWAFETLGRIGDPSIVDVLLEELTHCESLRSRCALIIRALGELGDRRAVLPLLERAATGLDWHIVPALGKLRDARAIPYLATVYRRERDGLKHAASEAIARIGGSEAVEPLLEVSHDPEAEIRREAIEALGGVYSFDERVPRRVMEALRDRNQEVRRNAVKILGAQREVSAVSALAKMARTERRMVQQAARKALEKIGTPEALAAIQGAEG